MKNPLDALLAAVDREPDSLEARRVLGDWLSENGEAVRSTTAWRLGYWDALTVLPQQADVAAL